MARPQNFQRPFHPFSPFNPVCMFGDEDIARCQNEVYYMTGRLRAILLARLDGSHTERHWGWWNIRFSQEVQLANSLMGWATIAGSSVDIPYLLRSICVFGPFLVESYQVTFSADMERLLRNPPEHRGQSAVTYPEGQAKFINEWWTEGSDQKEALTMELLHTLCHQPPDLLQDKPPAPREPQPNVRNNSTKAQQCPNCVKSLGIARRASTALKECLVQQEAFRQFAEWSAAESQRFSLGCKFLYEQARTLGRKVELEDLVKWAPEPSPLPSSMTDPEQTTYPSEEGIDWDQYPYEDTQGPLLSADPSQGEQGDPETFSAVVPAPDRPSEDHIGEDGFIISRWSEMVAAPAPALAPGRSSDHIGHNGTLVGAPASQIAPVDPLPLQEPQDVQMGGPLSPVGTEISSTGLSDVYDRADEDLDPDRALSDDYEGGESEEDSESEAESEYEDEADV
ncbi:hypothetical protein M413DRAFT_32037 [Hebeloma cylindrosporum]|uniref:Uncharacterized protein n=1 Tax=Hebeloma cylindrosporum TaxID=76867 RepID=A0A0C3BV95_HEBCY|nr:hypothetical protein M413DRAFT_32037 [Hebeloma cylindrosporum h7]